MPTLAYRIVNVFTEKGDPFSGNPLCVFENAGALDARAMQALALQFNLSETTFILPSSSANARVRIFTPRYEMPFAGHPTLGTAYVCRELGLGGDCLALEMTAGVISVTAKGSSWTLRANAPRWREFEESPALLASMLGINIEDIGSRPLWVNTGVEQLIVPLTSEAAVRRSAPRAEIIARLGVKEGAGMAYVFAPLGERILARFFFQQGTAVLEDPATGSATANLGGWLVALARRPPCSFVIAQGEYTGRPSTLHLRLDAESRIFVSGDVVEIGAGTISI